MTGRQAGSLLLWLSIGKYGQETEDDPEETEPNENLHSILFVLLIQLAGFETLL